MKFANLSLSVVLLAEMVHVHASSSSSPIPPPPPPSMRMKAGSKDQMMTSRLGKPQLRTPMPPPPPPPPPGAHFSRAGAGAGAGAGASTSATNMKTIRAPLVAENEDQRGMGYNQYQRQNQHITEDGEDDAEDYSEQIMTREEAEQFSKGFKTEENGRSNLPPTTMKDDQKKKIDFDGSAYSNKGKGKDDSHESVQGESEKKHVPPPQHDESENELILMRERGENMEKGRSHEQYMQQEESYRDDRGDRSIRRPPPPQTEQEWIVPRDQQFRSQSQQQMRDNGKLHQPPPVPPQRPHPNANKQQQYRGQQMPRTYPQRPLPHQQPPHNVAPRDYQYNRGGRGRGRGSSTYHLQQHQRFGPGPGRGFVRGPGPGALVQRRPQPPPAKSLLQRFGKSLDALADVDSFVSQKAKEVMNTVSHSSGSVADSVSGVMRKGVFQGLDSVTGIKEGIKDTVRGKMSNIFGGAPTSATEARDEWEDDRRRTVTEKRRKAILGDGGNKRGGPGETYLGAGESPLQQHLYGLANELEDSQDTSREEGGGEAQQQQPNGVNAKEYEEVDRGIEDQSKGGMKQDDADFHGGAPNGQGEYVKQPERNLPKPDTNPYAILAYPASKDIDDGEESSDIEDYDDGVDPSTFFVSTPSMTPSTPRPALSFEFEDEPVSISQKMRGILKIPSFKVPFRRSTLSSYDSGWSDGESWETPSTRASKSAAASRIPSRKVLNIIENMPTDELLQRRSISSPVARKATANLLSSKDINQLGRLGRSKAFMDFMTLAFVFFTVHECSTALAGPFATQSWELPASIDDARMLLQQIMSTVAVSDIKLSETWAPFTLIASILSVCTSAVFLQPNVELLTNKISKTVKSTVLQSQLFLRLATGLRLRSDLEELFSTTVKGQGIATMEIARLRAFVMFTLTTILVTSVAVIRPICSSIFAVLMEIASYEGLREWPIDWPALGNVVKDLGIALYETLSIIFGKEFEKLMDNPLAIVSTASLVAVLFVFSQLSILERGRSTTSAEEGMKNPSTDGIRDIELATIQKISNIGASSASRLGVQMQEGGAEKILLKSQIVKNINKPSATAKNKGASTLYTRKLVYVSICGILTSVPLIVYVMTTFLNGNGIDWEYFSGIILVLLFTNQVATRTLFAAIDSSINLPKVSPFLQVLSNTASEVDVAKKASAVSTGSSSSPKKGILISDLWVAHAAKRAWACRGINISCKAGEVVVILGEQSSGKTRLLTAVGELLAAPPKGSRTTTIARGKISVGGVELPKWNKSELRRKTGLILNDARTLSDTSQLHSGSKLRDILRPGRKGTNEGAAQSAVSIATQFTGLSDSLISRLPEKMETIVTANEDEVKPSNPNSVPISAAQWSKVFLTKIIAETVLNNDYPLSAPDSVSKSLAGSILLFDDVTDHLNEIEEIKLIKSLKSSGAATLLTSKRFAIGRFADRIIVLGGNGSVVESGTHAELIAKGSDNSVYAARWTQMMCS